jgi:RHS repeat-associated protein
VSAITGTVAGVANPAFNYDANGNLSLGLNRQWTWSSFDMPQSIDKLSGAQAVERTGFVYGPEHQRARQTVSPVSAGVVGAAHTVIWYAGAVEKEVATAANTTTIRTQLPQGLGWVQEVIAGTQAAATASATRQPRYPLEDHLGSPIAITDEAGTVLQRLSYDAWGRRRNLDGSDDAGAGWGSLKNGQDHSGYTGHEALDQLGLVHMNARLYDPLIGRHTSADPTVPEPANAQSLNRYSYVLNNGLAFVDPTGLSGSDPPQKNLDAPRCSIGPKCDAMIVIPQEPKGQAGGVEVPGGGTFNGVKPNGGSSGLGLKPKIQGWIDAGVEAGGYHPLAKGLGAAGTALNEVFVPDSKGDVALAMFGPIGKLGKIGKVVDLVGDSAKGVGEYGTVLGHHVHAKRAFEGVDGYDRMKVIVQSPTT